MKPTKCLVLGSCLVLQAMPGQSARKISSESAANVAVPLYHHSQARELLGLGTRFGATASDLADDRSLDLTLYVNRRTREMLPADFREDFKTVADALVNVANRYEMDPLFLMAVIKNESRFNPAAVGSHGEIGLMQIKPSTAEWLIEQDALPYEGDTNYEALREALRDPATNIAFGAAYLAKLRTTFKGRGPLYVSAYNMGAVNLKSRLRNGERPRIYSDRILAVYTTLSREFQRPSESSIPALTPRVKIAGLSQTLGRH